jgi:hypothetical protein
LDLFEGYGSPPIALTKKKANVIIELFFYEAPVLRNEHFKKLDFIYQQKPAKENMNNSIRQKLY